MTITDGQTNYLNRTLIDADWDITYHDSFNFGKYEIRAAQPKGDFIWTDFKLISYEKEVEIFLMKFKQQAIIEQEFIHGNESSNRIMDSEVNLNDFRIYSVEFNETEMIWRIDGSETYRKNISGIFDQEPNLRIQLHFGVGGDLFGDPEVNVKPFEETDCPSLIIDYIRYYEFNKEEDKSNVSMNTVTRDDICKQIKLLNE